MIGPSMVLQVTTPKGMINWVLSHTHRTLFRRSGGRLVDRLVGMPVLMLTTTGRSSGQPRQTMLTVPVQQDRRLVLVASNGGNPRHPDWFVNLRDHPEVEILWNGRTQRMHAVVASETQRAELWPKVVAAYSGYAKYQARSPREIPLVLLEP